ncbi:MAG: AAA family ATPase [Clostridium sp.]|nr:AAA family ATPase [Clostridium sp.]
MKLKQLTIKNLASIEEADIDFSGEILGGAPIFLICGETGAGKSTILDAICLALYGKTPRMDSTPKEEIDLYDSTVSARDKQYSSDNGQLLRRGAGQGGVTLTFDADDGREYLAKWHIHRSHNKPDKRLQDEERSLSETSGSYSETRKGEIDRKIVELTGLSYDQFCRTIMLAQGEFTKFLKSQRRDKSAILEKLTGTEIYSEIGRRIAVRYNTLSRIYEEKKSEVASVTLLSEGLREETLRQIREKNELKRTLTDRRAETAEAAGWLETRLNMAASLEKKNEELQDIVRRLTSPEFIASRDELDRYERSADGRRFLSEKFAAEKRVAGHRRLEQSLSSRLDEARAVEKIAAEELRKSAEMVDALAGELEQIGRPLLIADSKKFNEEDRKLGELQSSLTLLESNRRNLGENEASRSRQENDLRQIDAKIDSLTEPIRKAEEEWLKAKEAYEKAELSVDQHVSEIRARLSAGDICPVCGSQIVGVVRDEFFQSILEPRRLEKERAEALRNELVVELKSLKKTRISAAKQLAETVTRIETIRKQNEKSASSVAKQIEEAGFSGQPDIPALVAGRRAELKKLIEAVNQRLDQAETLDKQLKKVRKDHQNKTTQSTTASAATVEAEKKMAAWQSNLVVFEENLRQIAELLDSYLQSAEGMTEETLALLASLDQAEMIRRRSAVDAILDSEKRVRIEIETFSAQLKEHLSKKPAIEPEVTIIQLKETIAEFDRQISDTAEAIGKLVGILDEDKKKQSEFSFRMAAAEKAAADLEKWTSIYQLLGDQEGAKFRAVAQSFILEALLVSANRYLTCFTDRYQLTSNPGSLVIMVRDSYRPSEPQPSSILSGGESFMASLALALALADLRGGDDGSDILFIDEGFGTLSPEILANVMDTLERLHSIGRGRVGLISHVAELRERIPCHINVVRESPALSRVIVHTQ